MRTLVSTAAMLVGAGALHAHHSISMFDISTSVWLEATFAGFDRVNPHSIVHLEESMADGEVRRWSIEGPPAFQLDRRGVTLDTLSPGDVIEVCGFALKEEFRAVRSPETGSGYPPDFLHGHLLVLPGGEMRAWGSYGKMENCIRPGDSVQTWVDFVNSDERAHQLWCGSRAFSAVASTAPPGFVAEVDRRIEVPCG
jgi:hypothetical protein